MENTDVRKFLIENASNILSEGSSRPVMTLPDYGLQPREFLSYAEDELTDLGNNRSVINCISNLNRAMGQQVDIFFYTLNLIEIYRKKRLGMDRKLGFIEKCGIFNKGSLTRVWNIRNKFEHYYQVPSIDDINIYFDLVSSFITVMEYQSVIGGSKSELNFNIVDTSDDKNADPAIIGHLKSFYDKENQTHAISWSKNGEGKSFSETSSNLVGLAEFIKYHVNLINIQNTNNGQYANLCF